MNTFQILLASNTEANEHIMAAMDRLNTLFPSDIRFSKLISSDAINKAGEVDKEGGSYLNALCLATSEMSRNRLESLLKEIEAGMGRKQDDKAKKKVVIDLDLVVWNGEIVRPWDVAQTFYQSCLISLQKN